MVLLIVNLIFGTIIVTLIKRESDRIEIALKKFSTFQDVLQRLVIEFTHYRDEQKRLTDAAPAVNASIERSERQLRCIAKKIDKLSNAVTTIKSRLALLRSHSFPFIPDAVWGTVASVEEDLDNG
jgi:predicted  nucleic acid-binding Zn-ribbon protein